MAGFLHADVVEQILIRLHVEDLIRCKSVCKSWYFLITSPGFVNRHLNHSYNKERYNQGPSHRRMIVLYTADSFLLVGSSNGLVCIFVYEFEITKLLVGNPVTREIRQLKPLPSIILPSCWGFGYDSYKDDYKVIVGFENSMKQTCVQMLSLKSNVWRVIGDLKYTFIRRVGMLWDGALHWIIRDQNHKEIIISYDLSKQEFKEIPRPDYDTRYEATSNSHRGIIKECLCIYRSKYVSKWRMKYHESWEQLPDHCERRYNFGHYNKFPVFVQSLVSPHVNQREGKQRRSFGSWIKCLSLMLLDTLHRDRGDPSDKF